MPKDKFQNKIDSFGIMQSTWMRNQIEGHLFIGPFHKHVPLGILGAVLMIFLALSDLKNESSLSIPNIGGLLQNAIIAVIFIYFSFRISKYQQAVIVWLAIKFTGSIATVLLMAVGTISSISKQQSDALPIFLLGATWLPWIEFIPRFTKYQKLITITRLLLTIPWAYMGIQSDHWH